MRKILSIILVILWMIIVFCFSSQVGDDSQVTSGNTIRKIITFINNDIDKLKLEEIVELLQPIVRKLAHFTLYTLGGILIFNLFNSFKLKNREKIGYSLLVGALYAITDEIHQLFVPGRSGMIKDVFIDTLGIITGVIVCIIIFRIVNIIINKMIKIKGE